jgi:N-acetylglucosamine-6-sulfatase
VFSREARRFIEDAAAARTPFFTYIAPHAPHDPAIPAPRHQEVFAGAKAPRVRSFNEADMSDKPSWIHDLPMLSRDQIAEINALHRNRLRALQAVDDMVGALIETLRNTYIFFASDNGFHKGEHRLGAGKGTPYEESIRLPLRVRGPGVAADRVEERLAVNTDLAPTFAELAQVEVVPACVDGRSVMPLLRGDPSPPSRQAVLVEMTRNDPPGSDEVTSATAIDWDVPTTGEFWVLREAERVYVEYANGERELYDLRADPYQVDNLAADPARRRDRRLARQTGGATDLRRSGLPHGGGRLTGRVTIDDRHPPNSRPPPPDPPAVTTIGRTG